MDDSYGGGYSRTSYNAGGGDDAGGFVYGGSQGGSQSGAGKGYGDDTLRPVTIKQVIEAEQAYPDAPFRIDGLEVTQVTFVGMVRAISPQTTNVTFRLDDGTGIIEVKQWLDADKQDDTSKQAFALDSYVRVWGRLKSFNNKRHVGAHVIKPVADYNEVQYHLLEATYCHLFFTKSAPGGGGGDGSGANGGGNDSMFVDGGNGAGGDVPMNDGLRMVSARARQVYNWLSNSEGGNEGVHANIISQAMKISIGEVLKCGEELTSAGVTYTTIDDDTFAILDY
ncbi:replication factor A2 [Apiospora aurea]|uniref:Replication factor A2 n=1 Tax=Apiospora aurea TaxID=335848 RepID=A0ABR1QH59_9PEZI